MEAATHSHDHGPEIELNPATWRDAKRYAWLLGLVVPFAPFLAWASVEVTGFEFFWFFGPLLVFGVFPLLDMAIGVDPTNPP
ncbi:MAG TPA: alkane 1-monooxygenase, partial [Solirubrobacterales bacterium]|nr:alkane 1-monooxygenase [Solirubrobacterales bacterium]